MVVVVLSQVLVPSGLVGSSEVRLVQVLLDEVVEGSRTQGIAPHDVHVTFPVFSQVIRQVLPHRNMQMAKLEL